MILSDALFAELSMVLLQRYGLFYPPNKRSDLAHGMELACAAAGIADPAQLYAAAQQDEAAWNVIVEHLTIGETYFFRNTPQIDALRTTLLPELIERRSREASSWRSLRIWSAGCATGEEPYSLAMILHDLLPADGTWHPTILATDINLRFLEQARQGLYGSWSFRDTPPELRERFFDQEGQRWRLRQQIRQMVSFARLNLVEPVYPSPATGTAALDMILCRNVTIYFDEQTTRQIVERMYRALLPGGWLIVGHSEPRSTIYDQFEVHNLPGAVLYRKALLAPIFSVPQPPAARPAPPPQPSQRPKPSTAELAALRAAPQFQPPPPPPQQSDAEQLWRQAQQALKVGSLQVAEQTLSALVASAPQHREGLLALARLAADRGDSARAIDLLGQVLEQDALCVEAHHLLGMVHEHDGALDEALASYRRAHFLDGTHLPTLLSLASVWMRLGEHAVARRWFRNAQRRIEGLAAASTAPGYQDLTVREIQALIDQQLRVLGG